MEKQLSADETNDTTSLLEVDLRSKDLSPLHRKHHFTFTCSTRRLVLLCCTGVLFTASILRILVYAANSITCPKQKVHRLTCGRSVDEAKALGCVYDTLAHEWTPEPCFDESTMLEYQARADWHGYRTIESTESTSLEQMASTSPPNTFFAGESDHIIHMLLSGRDSPEAISQALSIWIGFRLVYLTLFIVRK
ncbi:hypothetical protein DL95DRAFT_385049 [Leptodontidium sp. 2 PMI_412]|nr:hypothetical protein DL95DRAFT_385049 [Leptodontidium sp. 2 PMI_412]